MCLGVCPLLFSPSRFHLSPYRGRRALRFPAGTRLWPSLVPGSGPRVSRLLGGGLFRGGFTLCLLAPTKLYIGSNTTTAVGSTPCCISTELSGMSSTMPPTFLSSFTPSCCLKYVLHSASRSLLPTPPSSPSIGVAPASLGSGTLCLAASRICPSSLILFCFDPCCGQ